MTLADYEVFLERKRHLGDDSGFAPVWMPEFLFDFQSSLVEWSLRRGRAAIFADCGLGKTPMLLVWAENIVRKTGKNVLILTPLAVTSQLDREAHKFGVEVHLSRAGDIRPGINVTNYERLHMLSASDFAGAVCDESSILKSFDGIRRGEITDFMRKLPYRLLCTATAAPNDYTELGTSSEALGYLGHMDMLNRFFKNDQNTSDTRRKYAQHGGGAPKWRFKGHAEVQFWRWICSWARALRRPSDLGFDDARFALPDLHENLHVVEAAEPPEGMLFNLPAASLFEQRQERRRTIKERCERVAGLVNRADSALVWCQLNPEGDLLERMIPGAIQVSGADSDEVKEARFMAFVDGSARVLITKPKIGAWGLNFQHCSRVACFPSHSYEQHYQGVRRCWRFGQTRSVTVDVVAAEGEQRVYSNLARKAAQADRMFSDLTRYMAEALHVGRDQRFVTAEELPAWLSPSRD